MIYILKIVLARKKKLLLHENVSSFLDKMYFRKIYHN